MKLIVAAENLFLGITETLNISQHRRFSGAFRRIKRDACNFIKRETQVFIKRGTSVFL